jgi:hypothetical protein
MSAGSVKTTGPNDKPTNDQMIEALAARLIKNEIVGAGEEWIVDDTEVGAANHLATMLVRFIRVDGGDENEIRADPTTVPHIRRDIRARGDGARCLISGCFESKRKEQSIPDTSSACWS